MRIPAGGGATDTSGLSQTVDDHYREHSGAIQTIRKDLDGYQGQIDGLDTAVSEHYTQHSDAIQTIRKDLDGYQSQIDGLDTTQQEHYTQHSDAIQTIRKDLDGYGSLTSDGADGYVAFFTGPSAIAGDNDLYWNRETNSLKIGTYFQSSQVDVLKLGTQAASGHSLTAGDVLVGGDLEVDGTLYADIGGVVGDNFIFNDNVTSWWGTEYDSGMRYNALQTPDTLTLGLPATGNSLILIEKNDLAEDFAFPQQTNPTLCIQSADHTTPTQRIYLTHDQTDGIIATGAGNILLSPVSEIVSLMGSDDEYPALKRVGRDIHFRQADDNDYASIACDTLDAYGEIQCRGVSLNGLAITETEHYTQHSDAIQTIRKDLDGYQSQIDGLDTTQQEHYTQHSDAIQTILKDLDGYGSLTSDGGDGYVAFFTGPSSIAGDNDLYWNRETNTLELGRNLNVGEDLTVTGQVVIADGTANNPSIVFSSADDGSGTGIYSSSPNQMDITSNGTQTMGFFSSGNVFYVNTSIRDDRNFSFGNGADTKFRFSTAQNPDCLMMGIDTTSYTFVITPSNKAHISHSHPAQSNPTLFIHSVTATSDKTQYVALNHNQTNAVLTMGKGGLVIGNPNTLYSTDITQGIKLDTSTDGMLVVSDESGGDVLLSFSGATDEYPALKRIGRDIHFRQADDNDYASIACDTLDAYGEVNIHGASAVRMSIAGDGILQLLNEAGDQGIKLDTSADGVLSITDESDEDIILNIGSNPAASITGTAADGYICFMAGSDGLVAGDNDLYWNRVSNTLELGRNLNVGEDLTITGQIVIANGTANNPSIVFSSDDDGSGTGIYRSGTNSLSLVSGGSDRLIVTGNYISIYKKLDTVGNLIYDSTAILQLGTTAASSHFLGTGDVIVGGQLECNSLTFLDGNTTLAGAKQLGLNSTGSSDANITVDTSKAQLQLCLGANLGRQLVLCDPTYAYTDFDHATPTNPTIFVHSVTNPNADNTQWLSLEHDQTDAVIASGKGNISLDPASGNVDILGNNIPAITGTAADGYICFMAGDTGLIAGDNDLFWNRETNSLTVGGGDIVANNRVIGEDAVCIGGTTSSDIRLELNGASTLIVRRGDDSASGALQASGLTSFGGITLGSSATLSWGTSKTDIYSGNSNGDFYISNDGQSQGVKFDTSTEDGVLTLTDESDGYIALEVVGQVYSALPATLEPAGQDTQIDWSEGNSRVVDLAEATGTFTINMTGGEGGASYIIKIINHPSSPVSVSIPNVYWEGGTAYSATLTNSAIDIVTLWCDDDENYYGSYLLDLQQA